MLEAYRLEKDGGFARLERLSIAEEPGPASVP